MTELQRNSISSPATGLMIFQNQKHPLKVFLQVNILNSNGVAVINKSKTGFDLIEKNGSKVRAK